MKIGTQIVRVRPRAFLLMEVLLAIMLFGFGALALLRALTATSNLAGEAKMELRMMGILQSALTQYSRASNIQETPRPIVSDPDELGVWTEVTITEMNEKNGELLETDDNPNTGGKQPLQQMFHIVVIAHYEQDGQKGELRADTFRYAPLYKQTAQ